MRAAKKAEPVPALATLTAQWAHAKRREAKWSREAEALRAEILAAGAAVGYEDEHLRIGETSSVDLADKKLLATLHKEVLYDDCTKPVVLLELVKAAAVRNDQVKRALELATHGKPRFEQARKKKGA